MIVYSIITTINLLPMINLLLLWSIGNYVPLIPLTVLCCLILSMIIFPRCFN